MGTTPFAGENKREILDKNKTNTLFFSAPGAMPVRPELKELIIRMMKTSPSKRPTAKEILSSSLLKKYLECPIMTPKKEPHPVKKLSGIVITGSTTTENAVSRSTTFKSPKVEEEAKVSAAEDPKSSDAIKSLIEEVKEDQPKIENISLSRLETLKTNQPLVKPNVKLIRLMVGIERVVETVRENSVEQKITEHDLENEEDDCDIGDDECGMDERPVSVSLTKYLGGEEIFKVCKKK